MNNGLPRRVAKDNVSNVDVDALNARMQSLKVLESGNVPAGLLSASTNEAVPNLAINTSSVLEQPGSNTHATTCATSNVTPLAAPKGVEPGFSNATDINDITSVANVGDGGTKLDQSDGLAHGHEHAKTSFGFALHHKILALVLMNIL
jgi:hypothetical protein